MFFKSVKNFPKNNHNFSRCAFNPVKRVSWNNLHKLVPKSELLQWANWSKDKSSAKEATFWEKKAKMKQLVFHHISFILNQNVNISGIWICLIRSAQQKKWIGSGRCQILEGGTKLRINFVSNFENGIFRESFCGVCFVLSYLIRKSIGVPLVYLPPVILPIFGSTLSDRKTQTDENITNKIIFGAFEKKKIINHNNNSNNWTYLRRDEQNGGGERVGLQGWITCSEGPGRSKAGNDVVRFPNCQ